MKRKKEDKILHLGALFLVSLIFGIAAANFECEMTGFIVLEQDNLTHKTVYDLDEIVNLTIPENYGYSISVVKDGITVIIEGSSFIPQEEGKYEIEVLIYNDNITKRLVKTINVKGKNEAELKERAIEKPAEAKTNLKLHALLMLFIIVSVFLLIKTASKKGNEGKTKGYGEIKKYIEKAKSAGFSEGQIKDRLKQNKWNEKTIDMVLK